MRLGEGPVSGRVGGQSVRPHGTGLLVLLGITALAVSSVPAEAIEPAGMGASQAQDATTDPLEEIRVLLARGEALFNSADQPDSIDVFSEVITRIDAVAEDVDVLPMMARSLSYRAQARFNLGQEAEADANLRQLLRVAPRTRLDPTTVSPKLIELFDALRAEIVGELALTLYPEATRVYVDGREVETTLEPIALAEGPHALSVELLGHTPHQREIEVVAGEMLTVDVVLERSSAIITVRTNVSGASVTVDGRAVGDTMADPDNPSASGEAELTFDGMNVGEHSIEITRDGYRPYSGEITVGDLVDYLLDPVTLPRMAGTVVLHRLPDGVELRIDDSVVDSQATAGVLELELAPGAHTIAVDGGSLGSFSTDVDVADHGRHEVSIELHPSVYFLGVVGNDEVGRATVAAALELVLGSGRWHRLALPQRDADALAEAGLQIDALRSQARGEGPRGVQWRFPEAQQHLDSQAPASLYVFAILSDDLVATHAEIGTFAGGPGPSFGDHIRVALDDPVVIGTRINSELLGGGSTFQRPWLGADFIDSMGAPGPVVLTVSPHGPTAAAGLSPGDIVVAVNGSPVATAADLHGALDELTIGAQLELGLASNSIAVLVGASPQIIDPDSTSSPFASVLIAVRQLRTAGGGSVPAWVLALNEASILLRAGQWEQVVRLVRPLQVPERPGVGASMSSYWLGLALSELGPDYTALARDAFERAAADRDGRLLHDDGPIVWPLARARARRLQQ